MKVIDNFLSDDAFAQLTQDIGVGSNMPWYPLQYVTKPNDGSFQLTHMFYADNKPQSNWFNCLDIFLTKISPASLLRIKSNLLTQRFHHVEHEMHIDMGAIGSSKVWTTGIFYMNTNNGYTKFEDETKVESVENRMVIFDSDKPHCSVAQTDTPYRMVINFNWIGL